MICVSDRCYVFHCQQLLDCGVPFAATRVTIESFNDTRLDSVITFHCDGSDTTMTAVCTANGDWVPNPASFKCGDESLGTSYYNNHYSHKQMLLCAFFQFPVDHQLLQLMVISPTTLIMLRVQR